MDDIASVLIISDIVVSASLIALILAVGLDATADDLLYVLRRPKLFFVGMLSVNVIMPVAAGLLIAFLPLTPVVKTGIVLMALSAVPPILPAEELKAGATKAYAYGLYAALALVTVLVVPMWVAVAGWVYGVAASVPVEAVASKVGWQVLLPLSTGLALRRLAPRLAAGAAPWVSRLSLALLFVGEVPVFATSWPMMMALVGRWNRAGDGGDFRHRAFLRPLARWPGPWGARRPSPGERHPPPWNRNDDRERQRRR